MLLLTETARVLGMVRPADVVMLRARPHQFGMVASDATMSRIVDGDGGPRDGAWVAEITAPPLTDHELTHNQPGEEGQPDSAPV